MNDVSGFCYMEEHCNQYHPTQNVVMAEWEMGFYVTL